MRFSFFIRAIFRASRLQTIKKTAKEKARQNIRNQIKNMVAKRMGMSSVPSLEIDGKKAAKFDRPARVYSSDRTTPSQVDFDSILY